jgi:hypothetical protein
MPQKSGTFTQQATYNKEAAKAIAINYNYVVNR